LTHTTVDAGVETIIHRQNSIDARPAAGSSGESTPQRRVEWPPKCAYPRGQRRPARSSFFISRAA
jgi:hypothetical protein